MRKLIIHIFLIFAVGAAAGPAWAEDPVDLVALQESGLSPETIGRYLAQNLDSTRVAPPISADMLSRLGEYGGDELAGSYLNLDKQTAHLQRRDFSPQVVEQLLAGDVGAEKLKAVLDGEAVKAAREAAAVPAPAVIPAPPLPKVTESELPPVPAVAPAPVKPVSVPEPPAFTPPASSAPAAPQAAVPTISQAAPPPAPQIAAPQPGFQDLRPGQAADPASKLPPPLDTYELQRPGETGAHMGVTERRLADGHRVEVNLLGDPSAVGQEVITRPSGRKVYRYHSGNTGPAAPITDQEQDRRNREDLQIIHSNSN